MTKANTGTKQNSTKVFRTSNKTTVGRSVYLVERHFTGQRDFQQAIYSAVENEAKRENYAEKSA